MNNYWEERQSAYLYNKNLKLADKELSKQYLRAFNKTKKDLISLYSDLATADTFLVSDLYRMDRYYRYLSNLNRTLTSLGLEEKAIITDVLSNIYIDTLGEDMGIGSNPVGVKNVINAVWCNDGKNWSDRIWNNKTLLENRISDGLINCVSRGDNKDALINQLRADFGVGYNQAERLVRTELNYVANQATLEKYKNAGVKQYKILATHDGRECDCGDHDGEIFNVDEAVVGVNYPPFHPNCRCSVLAVLGGK